MSSQGFPRSLTRVPVHLVGIKGTGMSALAEILQRRGALVSGSDTEEHFYTDEVLKRNGIPYAEGFRAENLPPGAELVVYSAAYDPSTHPELREAVRRKLPLLLYTEALGGLSRQMPSSAVSGVNGKTTTTAMVGAIVKELDLPGAVLAGSAVRAFGDKSTLWQGDTFFVAETCEYRRHFLSFSPCNAIITSIEPDHLDYFHDYEDILTAFVQFGLRLETGGALIFCADDTGAAEAADRILRRRDDLNAIPYGFSADGPFAIRGLEHGSGCQSFRLQGGTAPLELRIPGEHSVLNAVAATALVSRIVSTLYRTTLADALKRVEPAAAAALREFAGSRRRMEIVGEVDEILVLDDYGHHPTAIRKTLEGIADFYPGRRIICDFMSHTYSRTLALLGEFAGCFESADVVLLHRIYSSAREAAGSVTGQDLARAVAEKHDEVHYFEQVEDAVPWVLDHLRPRDILITMGAGDNWRLGRLVLGALSIREDGEPVG